MTKPRQIMPRRLEVVIEKLDLAKEGFELHSEEWDLLDHCQEQMRELLRSYTSLGSRWNPVDKK